MQWAPSIELIGAPFDLCGQERGSRLGPGALRIAGLAEALRKQGANVSDLGDVPLQWPEESSPGLRDFDPLARTLADLKGEVGGILKRGHLPIVMGGEHSLAIAGLSACAEAAGGNVAVLWLDAHADLNTPKVSPSGNIHGMPLAAVCGMTDGADGIVGEQWNRLVDLAKPGLPIKNLSWFGLREVDQGEAAILREEGPGFVSTLYEIDRFGVEHELRTWDAWLQESGITNLYISFDVDVMDPILAPGTGTAVRGGLTYRETQLVAELLHEFLTRPRNPYTLMGVEIMETNPIPDRYNETAVMAVEWAASLFGKTILGGPR